MPDLSEPHIIEAVDLLYDAALAAERLANTQLDQAARLKRLASALQDVAHGQQQLRVVT